METNSKMMQVLQLDRSILKENMLVMNKTGNFSRKIIIKIQVEIPKLKNSVSEIKKKTFYGLNSRLEITEELMNLRITDQQKLSKMWNKEKNI